MCYRRGAEVWTFSPVGSECGGARFGRSLRCSPSHQRQGQYEANSVDFQMLRSRDLPLEAALRINLKIAERRKHVNSKLELAKAYQRNQAKPT